ncbi:IS66 family insertion sequence element accessory protein TnpB [Halomonas sp. M5N1S17]|nr:IS66 family insertion sequence element accessory protein TnpB [Halomonas alkalisoli]
MRAGPDTVLARVVKVFGIARPHCAYLFANRRGNRMKVLIHDGLGIWLCARCLNQGKFNWAGTWHGDRVELSAERWRRWYRACPGSASGRQEHFSALILEPHSGTECPF